MNKIRIAVSAAVLLLGACAATPEQRAAAERMRIQREQSLQVELAAQCDPETAALIKRRFDLAGQPPLPEAENKKFRLKYADKVSDPVFQACYKMAWQNYISREQLREMRRYRYYDDWGYPFYRPPFWW